MSRVGDAIAFELPRRPLGGLKVGAAFMVAFGLAFAAAPLATAVAGLGASPDPFDLIFLAFSLIFVAGGGLVALLGLAAVAGCSSVVIRPGTIVAVERLGPLRWRRSAPAAGLQRLEVIRGRTRINGRPVREGPAAELSALSAEFEDGRRFLLVVCYPESWLLPLADTLSAELVEDRPAVLVGREEPPAVEVVRVDADDEGRRGAPVARPAGSTVTLAENPDGITLTIPPAGLRKGSRGLFAFAVLWCGFMTVFTTGIVAGPLLGASFSGSIWAMVGFCALFWAIGVFLIVASINMGRRRAIIDVVDDVLLINRANLFGLKSHQWDGAELETVIVGPSGLEVNEVPVLELKVCPKTGREVGLFAGRDADELRWIAWKVRERLRLHS